MDKEKAKADIIAAALPIVPFEGWSMDTLRQAAQNAGYEASDVVRIFPGGAIDALDAFSALGDAALAEALAAQPLQAMKYRERVATAVRLRLSLNDPYREAVRKAVAMHALPFYALRGLRALYNTVDTIWRDIGDTSTNTSFFTKRLSLAGVYSSTLLYWIDDKSPDHEASWAFLERRIDNVMTLGKLRKNLLGKV
jgi:ubiquinone biosynthesis protein COQ9